MADDEDDGEWDGDPDEDEGAGTAPCPYCRREIHEEAQRCPHCGS